MLNLSWNNTDNGPFYDALTINGLKEFAKTAGLFNAYDLFTATSYWSVAKSILDVGSGYGRGIQFLLKNNYQGVITSIERSPVLFAHLQKQFGQHKNIKLLQSDIRYLILPEKYDLIFMLWSGIADFTFQEQAAIIKHLATLLTKNGKIIIDTLSMDIKPLQVAKLGTQFYLLKVNDCNKYIYEPNEKEIECYAKAAGLYTKKIVYYTETKRERWMYILS